MEMLNVMELWTGGLTILIAVIGYMMHEKFAELARISILLNKTREEVARDNVTQAEVDKIMDHIDQRFNKLEEKIDRLIHQEK
jgi:CHASE3 domain sensor protein|tara:strand:+ start:369 stop:617 length:249 start_codon:yes stop_codon:yes gene_type:complete